MWYVWWLQGKVYHHRKFRAKFLAVNYATIMGSLGYPGVQVRQGEV